MSTVIEGRKRAWLNGRARRALAERSDHELIALVKGLWREGYDTYEIGLRISVDEHVVVRALHRRTPA